MALVETVRGPVETARLGSTLMHEHVFILDSEINHNYPERSWEGAREARVAGAAETLRGIAARGIDTIVDLTVSTHTDAGQQMGRASCRERVSECV